MPDTENSREDFAVTLSPAGLKPNDWNRYLRRLALKEHQAMKSPPSYDVGAIVGRLSGHNGKKGNAAIQTGSATKALS